MVVLKVKDKPSIRKRFAIVPLIATNEQEENVLIWMQWYWVQDMALYFCRWTYNPV